MSEEPSTNSTATQGDLGGAPPPPYGPAQPGYLPAELVDPPPQVGYSPAGDQTASLQDIHSTATQGDPSEGTLPPYGPPQPGYLPAELVDPPTQVGYRYSPRGDQTASLQDIHSIDLVDRPARRITRQESDNWCTELRDCCLIWYSTCGDICNAIGSCICCVLKTCEYDPSTAAGGDDDCCNLLLICTCLIED